MLVLEGEQVGVERHPAREGLGAVDRVEDPPPPRGAGRRRLLLAEHAVAGERLAELLAEVPLGVLVGGRDGRAVPLALDGQVGRPEPAQRALPGRAHEGDGGVEGGLVGRRRGHRGSLAPRRSGPAVRSRRRPGTSRPDGPSHQHASHRSARRDLARGRLPARTTEPVEAGAADGRRHDGRCVTGYGHGPRERRARPAAVPGRSGSTSLPPQCGGPDIVGWDWAPMRPARSRQRHHVGRLHRRRHLRRRHRSPSREPAVVPGARETASRAPIASSTPCPEPAGGWVVIDPATTTQATQDAVMAAARSAPDYSRAWVDQSINPSYADGEIAVGDEPAMNDPDAPDRERSLHRRRRPRTRRSCASLYGRPAVRERGPSAPRRSCCTSRRSWATEYDLLLEQRRHDRGAGRARAWSSTTGLQAEIDERYGEGVVDVQPALTPLEAAATSRWRCTWSPCSRASPRGRPRGRCPTPSRLRRGPRGPTRCPC